MPRKPEQFGAPKRKAVEYRPVKREVRPRSSCAQGYGYRWQKLRAHYLRMNSLCVTCGRVAHHVDHIEAKASGGTDAIDNLQSLCISCHSRKTVEHDGGFGRAKRGNDE